jgi:hypothetical protein
MTQLILSIFLFLCGLFLFMAGFFWHWVLYRKIVLPPLNECMNELRLLYKDDDIKPEYLSLREQTPEYWAARDMYLYLKKRLNTKKKVTVI